MDAYASGPYGAYIPYHLVTQEFFQLAWHRLENGGCLVYNVVGAYGGELDEVVRAVYSTLWTTFQAVYAFEAVSSTNTVFVAQKIGSAGTRTGEGYAWPQGPWLRHPLSTAELTSLARISLTSGLMKAPSLEQRVTQFSGIQGTTPTGAIYTDNYAPVDIARGRRHNMHRQ
jgi:hypothetical protein